MVDDTTAAPTTAVGSEAKHCVCCTQVIEPQYLMCQAHWRQVPGPMQCEVDRLWQAFNMCCVPRNRAFILSNYRRARDAAVQAVQAAAPARERGTDGAG